MELINFLLFIVLFLLGLWLLCRCLAWLLVLGAERLWGVSVRVGGIGFCTFGRIHAKVGHLVTIEIERIWFASSYINKEACKPFTLCCAGMRVQVDLTAEPPPPPPQDNNAQDNTPHPGSRTETEDGTTEASPTGHRAKKDLSQVLKYIQMIGLKMDNIVIVVHGSHAFNGLVDITDVTAHCGSSTQDPKLTQATVEVKNLSCKVLNGAAGKNSRNISSCLAELSLSTKAFAELDSKSNTFEAFNLCVCRPSIHLTEGFLLFLDEYKKETATSTPSPPRQALPSASSSSGSLSSLTSSSSSSSSLHGAQHRGSDMMPKRASVCIEQVEVIVSKDTAAMRSVRLKVSDISASQTDCSVFDIAVHEVHIFSQQANIASIKIFKVEAQVEGEVLAVNSNVEQFFLGYHYEEWQYWNSALFSKLRDISKPSSPPQSKPSEHTAWWQRRRLKVTLHGSSVSVACANAGCSGLKAGAHSCSIIAVLNPSAGESLLTERDCKLEVEVDSLYCKTAEGAVPSLQLSSKHHHRNTMLFGGILIIKINLLGREIHIDCLVDSLQVELASQNLRLVAKLMTPFLHGNQQPRPSNPPGPAKRVHVNAELNCINLYAVADNEACCMVRLNMVTVKLAPLFSTQLAFMAIKINYMDKLQNVSDIVRSQDISAFTGYIRSIIVQGTAKHWNIEISEELKVTWLYALHMTLHEVISEASALGKMLPSSTASGHPPANKVTKDINFNIQSQVRFTAHFSKAHSITLQTSQLDVMKNKDGISVKTPLFEVLFDQHDIIKVEEVSIEVDWASSLAERLERVDLELPSNRTVHVSLQNLRVVFPYNYKFAACLSELQCWNKWRKVMYPSKVDSAEDGGIEKLPPDILIDAKTVMIQICDDPFEVKLGDNHELLRDEQVENEKRVLAMDKRVQELRKLHGLLPGSKVEALYKSLQEKSAAVYLQRSQALYASSPMRTRLVAWTLNDLHVNALADTTFHGKRNIVRVMCDIDKKSPYPEDDLTFSTLWCRQVNVDVGTFTMQLRDYALPLMDIQQLHLWGRLVGAEQRAQTQAECKFSIHLGKPWPVMTVKRNMQPIKFFHDFSCDVASFCITYGPCWEPCMAFVNQALNLINKPSSDPSPPLPFWDKSRLLLHGRLTMCADKMRLLYHASLDPYNMTELMDWTWTNLLLDWTNAKWVLKGDLDIFARTASKYDDCRLLHLPNLRFCILLEWLCIGDPNDHHSVSPCVPDKVPEPKQKHDSYEKFRSQNMNVSVSLETSPGESSTDQPQRTDHQQDTDRPPQPSRPGCLFYNSTLRWMDKIKMCMARVARPIKRGKIYNILTPRKPQLSRHYKNNKLSVKIHEFEVLYWGSFGKQHGLEMRGKAFSLNIGTELNLQPVEDGLTHRARADWRIKQFLCDLGTTTIYLCSARDLNNLSMRGGPVTKSYFLSLEKLSYQRAEECPSYAEDKSLSMSLPPETLSRHKIQIYNARASWTVSNRDVGVSLYDTVMRAQTLKKNLSSAALKGFTLDERRTNTPSKPGSRSTVSTPDSLSAPSISSMPSSSSSSSATTFSPSPLSKMQSGPAYSMLTKLVNESDSKFVAVHEEIAGGNVPLEELHGIAACQTDDVLSRNWHVELINSQVQLRGVETSGYVIVSTGKASILSCDHKAVWRDQQLKSKSTWVGSVESMQYYATVEPGQDGTEEEDEEDVVWLTQDQIQQATDHTLLGLESMMGSSQTVGCVIVGSSGERQRTQQLQRIISRCKCQFFFASYGELDSTLPLSPTTAAVTDMLGSTEEGVDSFSLLHHDLNICTNSPQYLMILDIVNNLLLHSEPKKKELLEKVQSMRFQLHLMSVADQKTPIQQKQNQLRKFILTQRKQEKELWMLQKALDETGDGTDLMLQMADIEAHIFELKEQISEAADQLSVMVSSFKESQLIAEAQAKNLTTKAGQQEAPLSRRIELCFKHAEWRMTDTDGQIYIADLMMRNFLYTKLNRDDNSGSHQVELGFVKVTNLQPNTPYKDVLGPQDPHGQGFSERQMMLRVLCKFKAPVGGISIREHFEVNVVPLQLQLTKRFYNAVMKFFFPGKNAETEADSSDDESEPSAASKRRRNTKADTKAIANSSFYVNDIDKMKERAAKNNMFLYIKIPEVPLRVSYKGLKDKNISDVHDFTFLLPTIEYHNTTWTWLDMLMAMKNDSKKVLISQAIKQKLHLKSRNTSLENAATGSQEMQEDHKAKLLFGNKILGGVEKTSSKKSLFGKAQK